MQKRIIVIVLILSFFSGYFPVPATRAQTTPSTNQADEVLEEGGDGYEGDIQPADESAFSDLAQAQDIYDQIVDRLNGDIYNTGKELEFSLPRLGMSQCDMRLIRDHAIDQGALGAVNHLVTREPRGAGMTYLHVTFNKECEEEVPELIGGAYPVEFTDDSPQPSTEPSTDTPSTNDQPSPPPPNTSSLPTTPSINMSSLIPSAYAAADTSPVEPPDAEQVHERGQAVDIMAAGLVMCTTKSGGLFGGIGSKTTRQAPRPIKVSWQTDKGVSNVQTPFGANFNQMAGTAGLDDFLAGFESQDGTYQAKALQGAFTMMGFQLLANEMGIRPGSFDAENDPLNYSTIGYALLADKLNLPDASVFNPFINKNDSENNQNPFQTTRNNLDTLLHNGIVRTVERDLKLNAGSLNGKTWEEVLLNAGKRRLEKDLGLRTQSLAGAFHNPEDILQSIGQSKTETYLRLPTGATNSKDQTLTNLQTIQSNIIQALQLTGEKSRYAEQLMKTAFGLPSTANAFELSFSDSAFWKSDAGKQAKERLRNMDRQLFAESMKREIELRSGNFNGIVDSFLEKGKIRLIDTILDKSVEDVTFRMITGDLKLQDYKQIVGLGTLLTEYGAHNNTARAFDLPLDKEPVFDAATRRYITNKNEFLGNLLLGKKNNLVALGVGTLAKALQHHPDERVAMVQDALAGKRQFGLSGSRATLSINLSPLEFLQALGMSLATDTSKADFKTKAEQRANALINLAKQRFGNVFEKAATNALGDPALLSRLRTYDATRPDTRSTLETFSTDASGNNVFRLSDVATKVEKVTIFDPSGEQAESDATFTLGSDKQSVSVEQAAINQAFTGSTVKITYIGRARKSGESAQISPDLIDAIINDEKGLRTLALQYGAAKTGTALGLAPDALIFAAQIADPSNKFGMTGVGQARLEYAGGLASGALAGDFLDAALRGVTTAQFSRIFRLESGWYDKVVGKDEAFLKANGTRLFDTDDFYRIEQGSTQQVLTGAITFDQYKRRIAGADLKYKAGNILASKFSIHAAGYKLSQQDFFDLLDGSYYTVMQRIGARTSERNHGMPVGALAASVISGKNDVSLFTLGTNIVATTFNLRQVNLASARSLAEVATAVGQATLEQALGFKDNSFQGNTIVDVVRGVGAEDFANAFSIPMPDRIKQQLNGVQSQYRPDLVKEKRDEIISKYLTALLEAPEGSTSTSEGEEGNRPDPRFSAATLARFKAIDRILFANENGDTLRFINSRISPQEFIKRSSDRAVASGIRGELTSRLGIPEAYAIRGEEIINKLTDASKLNDSGAFAQFTSLIADFGGINIDAKLGWDKGAFAYITDNVNNPVAVKQALISQGTKVLGRLIGLDNSEYQMGTTFAAPGSALRDPETALVFVGSAKVAQIGGFSELGPTSYTTITNDLANLFNGRFSDGMLLFGAGLMAKSDDMKKAGITYEEFKYSILGDLIQENDYVNAQLRESGIDIPTGDATDFVSAGLLGSREVAKRSYMTEARQSVSYKYIDFQAQSLLKLDGVKIPQGFARAMIGGQYSFINEAGQRIDLTGDAARWKMGKEFLVAYGKNNIPYIKDLLQGVDISFVSALADFLDPGSAAYNKESALETKLAANNNAGFRALGSRLDPMIGKAFGIDRIAPGTGSALLGYAFDGNSTKLEANIWQAWQFRAFDWADKALGFKSGTAGIMYQGIVGYQSAMSTYRVAAAEAFNLGADVISTGGTVEQANKARDAAMSKASRQMKTQTAMIIASVANIVFQKQFASVESALGIQPGTLIYLIQYLVSPDPISLGLFIFFNFLWGKTSTTCGIDHYPGRGTTPASVLAIQGALGGADPNSLYFPSREDFNQGTAKLDLPDNFDGQSNEKYRSGIKAGAQYEVRRVIGSLLLASHLKNPSNQASAASTLTPMQIGTYSKDDVNLFEPLSTQVYGTLAERKIGAGLPSRGPGWYESMTDRIHVGY